MTKILKRKNDKYCHFMIFIAVIQITLMMENSLVRGEKCLDPDTPILMWNGSTKLAKKVKTGDLLVGDNNRSRKVLSICEGSDKMYNIRQRKGDDYIVSETHILILKFSGHRGYCWSVHKTRSSYRVCWKEGERQKSKSFSMAKYKTKKDAEIDAEKFRKKVKGKIYWVEDRKYRRYCLSWLESKKIRTKAFTIGRSYKTPTENKRPSTRLQTEKPKILRHKKDAFKAMKEFRRTLDKNNILEISVKDYLKLPSNVKKQLMGYKVGVEFPGQEVQLNPYILGVWLGDGSSKAAIVTNIDKEIIDYLYTWCDDQGYKIKNSYIRYNISGGFLRKLKDMDLWGNKHIPRDYLVNNREVRMAVLAGLLDTDGHYHKHGYYQITQKNKRISDGIVYLARSLGFGATQKEIQCTATNSSMGRVTGTYYSCHIFGEGLEDIPCLIERKKARPIRHKKNVLVTGVTVEPLGKGEYCGFKINGNGRFLLEDFTKI